MKPAKAWCFLAALIGASSIATGAACSGAPAPDDPAEAGGRARQRAAMVRDQIEARGVHDPRVLAAMRQVPRHELVPESVRAYAYEDRALPIGFGQTISQPYVVAAMTEALALRGDEKVLEIGTGSGYQAAVLSRLARQVFSIEIVDPLAKRARADLARLGYSNVKVRSGDGYAGWPDQAPFQAIIVTAAPDHVPQPLLDQLAVGGHMVLPVGRTFQELVRITRTADGYEREELFGVRFVPMTGEAEEGRREEK